ncbi:MAG TPA: NAD(P)H-hydrate dehydratase [Burkholderiales bacterium]|nr:NAD(P)H-hydrate dehydratase [Burkholderiales bacterium]
MARPASVPVYTTAEVRALERAAGEVVPSLMQRAGAAAAALAAGLVPESAKDVLVLAGPGNNGGDAYEAALGLKQRFFRVTLVSPAGASALPPDAARAQRGWREAGGETHAAVPPGRSWGLVVDGLFGIGLAREPAGEYAQLIDYANAQRCPVLALDIPSGLESDSGRKLGRAVRATHTITFIALKPGLLTLDGPDHCGALTVADLGLEVNKLAPPRGWVADPGLFTGVLAPRPRNFHKGLAGSVAILGGDAGMCGAALLAGRAALKLGAGRVYVGMLDEHAPRFDSGALELMLRPPDEALGLALDALVVGPGLGQSERAAALLGAALASELPCVLDADALNLIARNPDLRHACARRPADTLITPHPAEAARLLGTTTDEVQRNRIEAAQSLAAELSAHAVLKGNGSVLAARDGHWFVNTSGNPGMASAGTGDVLSGILGALLGQGLGGEAALVLGVHLHGCAADERVSAGRGPVGLTASELIEPARRIWNGWLPGRQDAPGARRV